ncbi:hypothetical protein ABPG77_005781 [Micractinium sp. CCAP 211/92]
MASCVLVTGLDAATNCSEMTSLFESAGTVVSSLVVSPAADGAPGAAFVYYAEPAAAAAAVEAFDSFPFAGTFLEVRKVEAAAAARVLAALAEAQGSVAGSAPPAPALPARQAVLAPESASAAATAAVQPAPMTAPVAGPAVAFTNGPAVPMPAALTPAFESTSGPATRAPSTAVSETIPEPPDFGGVDYNPADWQPPSDWQPAAVAPSPAAPAATSAAGWTSAAASRPKAQPQQRAPAPAGAGGQPPAAASAAGGPTAPEWEVDRRCRIYVQGLRAGCSTEDIKAYFSKFGQLLDCSLVPKQRIAFLTYAKGEHGEAAMKAANGCSVPRLSPSGAEPLRLEYRDLDKIRKHFHNKREDALDTPTTRIFIGYFPRNIKARDVRAEVERYGDVEEVMLGGGHDGGDLFCFVQFKRVQDAARAKAAIHGHTMPAVAGARQLISVFKEPRSGY